MLKKLYYQFTSSKPKGVHDFQTGRILTIGSMLFTCSITSYLSAFILPILPILSILSILSILFEGISTG